MSDYMKLVLINLVAIKPVPTEFAKRSRRLGGARPTLHGVVAVLLALLLTGCGVQLPIPLPEQLPVEMPGIPSNWQELQGMMGDLGLPDLSQLSNVPGLDALGVLQTPPGGIALQGPVEMGLEAGTRIPGTGILFVGVTDGNATAQFEIDSLRASRRVGDSLDFDGSWPGTSGMTYQLRLRIYNIGRGQVRAAGVHRLVVENVQPQVASVEIGNNTLRFPHSVTVGVGEQFPGMTLGYDRQDERGAALTGLPQDEYPYRKVGDSVEWEGRLRADLPVEYHLRMLYYQETNATLGGVVIVSLPGQ
jgi:hypothetical protein